jgi:hypothetical protein
MRPSGGATSEPSRISTALSYGTSPKFCYNCSIFRFSPHWELIRWRSKKYHRYLRAFTIFPIFSPQLKLKSCSIKCVQAIFQYIVGGKLINKNRSPQSAGPISPTADCKHIRRLSHPQTPSLPPRSRPGSRHLLRSSTASPNLASSAAPSMATRTMFW